MRPGGERSSSGDAPFQGGPDPPILLGPLYAQPPPPPSPRPSERPWASPFPVRIISILLFLGQALAYEHLGQPLVAGGALYLKVTDDPPEFS